MAAVLVLIFGAAGACTNDDGDVVIQDAEEFVEDARRQAREAAQDVDEAGERAGPRDGDGRDDDGQVEIAMNGELACFIVPAGGGQIDVNSGAC